MRRYQAVCDRCTAAQLLDGAEIGDRNCPACGAGRLLGPFPVERGLTSPTPKVEAVLYRLPERKDAPLA